MADEKEKKKKAEKGKAADAPKSSSKRAKEPVEHVDPVPPRLSVKYREEIAPRMKAKFGYRSAMQIPRLTKIVINAGLGKSTQNIKIIDQAMKDIAAIAGQKPVACKSRLAISNFKLRAGLPIGVMVTLRGATMYEFLDRLISLALPRIRDFRGVPDRGFDGNGNFTMGLKDQIVFPEVNFDSVDSTFGMNITFVTTATKDEEGRALLEEFGFPFRKKVAAGQKAA